MSKKSNKKSWFLFKIGGGILGDLFFLLKVRARLNIYIKYMESVIFRPFLYRRYRKQQYMFFEFLRSKYITRDWFTKRIPYWISLFEAEEMYNEYLSILEVGSYEGLSTCFIAHKLPNSTIHCVDTWGGSDEHVADKMNEFDLFNQIEERFDFNTREFYPRISKHKSKSIDYLNNNNSSEFDLIYIDGSHHSDDVLIDALLSFKKLKVGGFIIFDDYFFKFYSNPLDNVAGAVNAFYKLKENHLALVAVFSQIIFKKIS